MAENKSFAELYFNSDKWKAILEKVQKKYDQIEKRDQFGGIISAVVYQDIMKHFDDQAGPDGPWKPWSAAYRKHLNKIGRSNNKILQFTGNLRQSFKPTSWKAKQEGILFINNAKTKPQVIDDNISNIQLQKMRRSERQKNITNKLKKTLGRKAARYIAKKTASATVKVEKRKKTKTKGGIPYAAMHDEGLGKMPKRKFMWLSAVGIKKLVDITLKWLAE